MKKIWFDLTNTPHVNFLKPIIQYYSKSNETILSARDFSETIQLTRTVLNREPMIIGKHGGKSKVKKIFYMLTRLLKLSMNIPQFDLALSCGGTEASLIAKLRRKKAITFDDNDISPNWMYSHFVNFAFFPQVISKDLLIKQGFKPSSIIQYNGYKEDIYISDYEPNEKFCESLPFKEYIVVRPENLMANYITKKNRSIVPELLRLLTQNKYNVLYLPRYKHDADFAGNSTGVYIPPAPVNGLDASFFSRGVISGAGSFSREAACLGKPAVSFYAGNTHLAVDRRMINKGWIFHSRNPDEIIQYIKNAPSRNMNLARSRMVRKEFFAKLDEIFAD